MSALALLFTLVAWRADPVLQPCEKLLRTGPAEVAVGCVRAMARKGADLRTEAVAALHAAIAEPDVSPHVLLALGTLEVVAGEPAAVERLHAAADAYAPLDDASGIVHARLALARYFSVRGHSAKARVEVEAAAVAATHVDMLAAMVDLERATQMTSDGDGDVATARIVVDRALSRLDEDSPMSLRSAAMRIGADLADWAGDTRAAARFSRSRAALLRAHGDAFGRVQAELDALRYELTIHDEAYAELSPGILDRYRALIDDATAAGNRYVAAVASCIYGDLLDDAEARERLLRSCIALRKEIDHTVNYGQQTLARTVGQGDAAGRAEARLLLDEALATATEIFDPWGQADGFDTRAGLRLQWGDYEGAFADWERSFAVAEAIRDRQEDAAIKAGIFSSFTPYYASAVGARLSRPDRTAADVERAFDVLERLRARQLLDALDAAGVTGSVLETTPAAKARAEAQKRATHLAAELSAGKLDATQRAATRDELDAIERTERELRARLAEEDPRFARMHQPSVPDLAEARAVLRPDEALIAFSISLDRDRFRRFGGGSWAFVLTADSTTVVRLPPEDIVVPAVDRFVADLSAGDGAGEASARALYDSLMVKAIAGLPPGVERLVLVPDAMLHRLPFAALRDSQGRALGIRFGLQQVPSAALFVYARRNPASLRRSFLALADPTTSPLQGESLPRLPGARIEGRHAAEAIAGDSACVEGELATEARLVEGAVAGVSILHIGAHALVSTTSPDRTFIALSPDAESDGRLQLVEVAAMPTAPTMVVLAGCQSAEGNLMAGDGPLGPARAFAVAGTRTVLASLWPLRDDDAVLFFAAFYNQLDRGQSVAEALRRTRSELAEAGLPPRAWAGIIAIGDGDLTLPPRVPEQEASVDSAWAPRRLATIALAMLVAFALGMAWHARRHPASD